MKRSWVLGWALSMGALAVGCSGDSSGIAGTRGDVARAQQLALTSDQQRILSFEAAPGSDWTKDFGNGSVSQSNLSSDALHSLRLTPAVDNEVGLVSTVDSLGQVGDSVSMDVRFDQAQSGWTYARLVLVAPSLELWWEELGTTLLSGNPGEFHTLDFALPANVRTALQGDYSDLTIHVYINGAAGHNYLVDKLDFHIPGEPIGSVGGSGMGGTGGTGGDPTGGTSGGGTGSSTRSCLGC